MSNKIIKGAVILSIAGIAARFLGIFFWLPLVDKIGDEGIGYYQLAYPIYSLFLAISYVGLPSAISKMVSEKMAKEDYYGANRIFKTSMSILIIVGIISSAAMFFGTEYIIEFRDWSPEVRYSLWGLSLAPAFVSIMGAFRGYFQGMQNMIPTGISQVSEAIVRVIVGITLAYILFDLSMGNPEQLGLAAGGATFGATAGAIVGCLVLFCMYMKYKKTITDKIIEQKAIYKINNGSTVKEIIASFLSLAIFVGNLILLIIIYKNAKDIFNDGENIKALSVSILGTISVAFMFTMCLKIKDKWISENKDADSIRGIGKSLLIIALPITLGSAVSSVIGLIDSMIIVSRLQDVGIDAKTATAMFGQLSGKTMTLINVPLTLSMAVALSVLPAISESITKNDKKELYEKINSALRFGLILGLPAAIGLASLAFPIFDLIYPKYVDGWPLLAIMSIALIFMIMSQILTAVLQGMGHFYRPIINLLFGAVVKIVLNYILVATALGVRGAAIASICVYIIYSSLNYNYISKKSGYKIEKNIIMKPVIASLVMGAATLITYYSVVKTPIALYSSKVATLMSIAVAVVVYIFTLVKVKGITEEDLKSFPKGDKIKRIFKKVGIM